MSLPEAHRRFVAFLARPQEDARLAEGALLIALEESPALDVAAYLQRLDSMAGTIKHRLGVELDPRRIVSTINTHLFEEHGFRGNQQEYYDPRNSFLNDVLDRKIGIPITLSVLYLDIGRQVGLPIVGVGMPGHFIVQYTAQADPLFIDPFYHGAVLTHEDCATRLADIYGQTVVWHDSYLQPACDHDILRRMLYNLKAIYIKQGDYQRALSAVERILLITPDLPNDMRDRGLLHYQLGHLEAALDNLQHYLQLVSDAPDAATINTYIAALRRQLER